MTANTIFLNNFWHLKVTQPFMCFRVNQVYMLLSQSNIFVISPRWIFISSPVGFVLSQVGFLICSVEDSLIGLTPKKFWKFSIFPSESSSPYRVTEKRCVETHKWSSRWYVQMIHWGYTCTYEMVERRWDGKVLLLTVAPPFWMMI